MVDVIDGADGHRLATGTEATGTKNTMAISNAVPRTITTTFSRFMSRRLLAAI